ncbi:MAG: AtpZ/AtpI family protein [Candidatus Bruticola sp.]
MDRHNEPSYSQELSAEELEKIFSGPSLADTISLDNEEELSAAAKELLNDFNINSDLLSEVFPEEKGEEAQIVFDKFDTGLAVGQSADILSSSLNQNSCSNSLSSQLNSMAVSAADIAARRTYKSEYEANTFVVPADKKAEITASLSAMDQNEKEESAAPSSDSPEALRERIKAYQKQSREKNVMAQSLGIVFSFGFTVAAVIMAFWWLGQRAAEYSGLSWLFYIFTIFGVLVGLYSGALVLKPFLREIISPTPSKNSHNNDSESKINKR